GPSEQARKTPERDRRPSMGTMDGFGKPEPRHGRRDERNDSGRPNRRGVAEPRQDSTQGRTKDEAKAEGGTNESVRARAILGLGHIGHIGTCRRNVATGQAVDDSGQEQHRDAVRQGKHHEADDGTQEAENKDGGTAERTGQLPRTGAASN